MNRSLCYNLLVVSIFLWCILIVVPPMCMYEGSTYTSLGFAIYKLLSPICHQSESRSLHLAGYKLAVCSRCAAIYFGFFFGVLHFRFFSHRRIRKPLIWWTIAVVPMIVDVGSDAIGVHSSDIASRLVTGGIFGILAAVILTPFVIQACMELTHHKSEGVVYEPKAR